jgi:triphosphoribosyl-dephospho-CoA synthase
MQKPTVVPSTQPKLSFGRMAELACVLEVTARKPGNVHRYADFSDCGYLDFLLSASAIVDAIDRASAIGIGRTVRLGVEATRLVVQTNTNLGMLLLLAPLAAVPADIELRAGVARVLNSLTVDDAREAYRAIRLARPGGLGSVPEQDVMDEPTVTLLDAMRLAADRDLIARQYTNGYAAIFESALPALRTALAQGDSLEAAIITAFLTLLAQTSDTLIARKRGWEVANEASARASDLVMRGRIDPDSGPFQSFDAWLRADGHARNPGATADLIAAALFVALRDGRIHLPISKF